MQIAQPMFAKMQPVAMQNVAKALPVMRLVSRTNTSMSVNLFDPYGVYTTSHYIWSNEAASGLAFFQDATAIAGDASLDHPRSVLHYRCSSQDYAQVKYPDRLGLSKAHPDTGFSLDGWVFPNNTYSGGANNGDIIQLVASSGLDVRLRFVNGTSAVHFYFDATVYDGSNYSSFSHVEVFNDNWIVRTWGYPIHLALYMSNALDGPNKNKLTMCVGIQGKLYTGKGFPVAGCVYSRNPAKVDMARFGGHPGDLYSWRLWNGNIFLDPNSPMYIGRDTLPSADEEFPAPIDYAVPIDNSVVF